MANRRNTNRPPAKRKRAPAAAAPSPVERPEFTARPIALLLKLRGDRNGGFGARASAIAAGAEVLVEVGAGRDGDGFQVSSPNPATWVRLIASDNPWDQAHEMMRRGFAMR